MHRQYVYMLRKLFNIKSFFQYSDKLANNRRVITFWRPEGDIDGFVNALTSMGFDVVNKSDPDCMSPPSIKIYVEE